MRINANAPLFAVWPQPEHLQAVVSAQTLSIARLEPVISPREQSAFALDLVFSRDGAMAVIPAIRVAQEMLVEPECPPLLWPAECARALGEDVVDAIEVRVLPWLYAIALARQVNDEAVRRFGDGVTKAEFDHARELRFAGAARYADVAVAAAPYVYAGRFAAGCTVGVRDREGGTGAALLSRSAERVACDLGGDDRNAFAARWFGRSIFGLPDAVPDVGVGMDGRTVEIFLGKGGATSVPVATPVPAQIVVSFDPEDSPPCRTFSVTCKAPSHPRPQAIPPAGVAVGGSAGNVLLLLPNATAAEHAGEADDARVLAQRLGSEGFRAEVLAANGKIDLAAFDLVHAFGIGGQGVHEGLQAARSRGIPVVATAALPVADVDAKWASDVSAALMRVAQDEPILEQHLRLVAMRRLDAESAGTNVEVLDGERVKAALAQIDVVLARGAKEEAQLRSRFAYSGPVRRVAAYVMQDEKVERVDELAGSGDFVFAHMPVKAVSNLMLLARASMRARLPLVVAGAIADPFYWSYLREAVDASVILLPHTTASQLAGLYRRARVFADVAFAQSSLHRSARAALSGCALVLSRTSEAAALWKGHLQAVDSVDAWAIQDGLEQAWAGGAPPALAQAAARDCHPDAAFLETVAAYAQSQAVPA